MPDEFDYFAYGSNMLSRRLLNRTPSARVVSAGYIEGFRLTFDKKSRDGSGKCSIEATKSAGDRVYGVVFRIERREKSDLDAAEGLGVDYREDKVPVITQNGTFEATTYIAEKREPGLAPYDWYKELVVAGAEEHELPAPYIAALRGVASRQDSNKGRDAQSRTILSESRANRPG